MIVIRNLFIIGLVAVTLLSGCSEGNDSTNKSNGLPKSTNKTVVEEVAAELDEQPGTVYYEIFVRSFYDSNGDGIGDLNGITEKLDYLNDGDPSTDTDLGVGGIWLMPIQPSPSYHGYDVTDYYNLNSQYGTLDDLKRLTEEAHKRGIKVIMDLVVNHSSKDHSWFKDSASGTDSKYRHWYTWAEDEKLDASGISAASGGKAFYSNNGSHYLATFWEGMPHLNFNEPKVREEMVKIGAFWLEQGLDGFRLDAAKHIYENLQSDRGEAATKKNVAWWQEFRKGLLAVKPDIYLIGEIWENSPVAVAPYLDKALDSGFNFGLAESIMKTAASEQNSNLAFVLSRTHELFAKASGGSYVDAPFLTNHDQNRVMSTFGGNVDHAKMAAAIALTLPGNPFLYYGEEIGLEGKKPDERLREPMPWYAGGKSGEGQTTWERISDHGGVVPSVEAQLHDAGSLLAHYRKLLSWRSQSDALRSGSIESISAEPAQAMAYTRHASKESVLVVHNLGKAQLTFELVEAANYSGIKFSSKDGSVLKGTSLTLPPYSTVVLEQ